MTGDTEPRRGSRLRAWFPWIVGIAIVVAIATQIPFAQFKASVARGSHLELALVEVAITAITLLTDSISTWIGMLALRIRWSLHHVIAIRGATYLLVLLNYAVGQGGFGYYLYRAGETAKRAVGATLFLLGTTLATLLVLAFCIWIASGGSTVHEQMWWTLVVGMIAFGAYLVVIMLRVDILARRDILAPLFEAGLRGHLIAIAGRMPHVFSIVISYWIAMRVWGIDLPFGLAVTLMPAIVFATALPISPAGLGTSQAAMVFFFADYAPGLTSDERNANMLAFGVVHFVYAAIGTAIVGLVCIPLAKRTGLMGAREKDSPA